MIIYKVSVLTNELNQMDIPITQEEYLRYLTSTEYISVSKAFPHLSKEQRDFLISGAIPKEWESITEKK